MLIIGLFVFGSFFYAETSNAQLKKSGMLNSENGIIVLDDSFHSVIFFLP